MAERRRKRSRPRRGGFAGSDERRAPRTKQEATQRIAQLAEAMPFSQLSVLTRELEMTFGAGEVPEAARGRSRLTGDELPSHAQMRKVRFENLQRAFGARRELLRETLTVSQVAELLGSGRQTPHACRKAGRLLAVRDGGRWRFPVWQFDPAAPDGVIAGLPGVLRALRGRLTELARVSWFLTPKPLLDGRTPLEALKAGDIDDVIAEAASVGAS